MLKFRNGSRLPNRAVAMHSNSRNTLNSFRPGDSRRRARTQPAAETSRAESTSAVGLAVEKIATTMNDSSSAAVAAQAYSQNGTGRL